MNSMVSGIHKKATTILFLIFAATMHGQVVDVETGWKMKKASDISVDGKALSTENSDYTGWIDAVVPGTVLTSLVNAGVYPDPYIGMNNELIPDIYDIGRDHYTYWFITKFIFRNPGEGKEIWLTFRGINYSAEIWLNGEKLTTEPVKGMFLRHRFNVTKLIREDGSNMIAVLVHPPDNVGSPNGGQGGDGIIGRDVTSQFTAGWDWIQPVRDRNTGIWDKVQIDVSGVVDLKNSYVRSRVPKAREPYSIQDPAYLAVTTELENLSDQIIKGSVVVMINGEKVRKKVELTPYGKSLIEMKEVKITDPKLWWPNGIGPQPLYKIQVSFVGEKDFEYDNELLSIGIRETATHFDKELGSRIFTVNGKKIFIKGGNWITTDAMFRFTPERYKAEVRMHAEMNMNMIRIWGGGITERTEFYSACDEQGLLVWQDLWITGDCNGRWADSLKLESQDVRRTYPIDHELFITSVEDQIKMLRNHPSLLVWSGGNEFPPPAAILKELKERVFPENDPSRYFLDYSTGADLMTNRMGGTGDGPYSLQDPVWFFKTRWFPFNSEIGSVGLPNIESLGLFIPEEDMVVPDDEDINPVWKYHKWLSYGSEVERYGKPKNLSDFVMKAQLVNYEQYKAIQEGYNAHMWEWYGGMLIWKNQNPWTSLRGQLYDVYLDQNAGYYGYKSAAQPFHIQLDLQDTTAVVINNSLKEYKAITATASVYSIDGDELYSEEVEFNSLPNSVTKLMKLKELPGENEVRFVKLRLFNKRMSERLDDNFYWIGGDNRNYSSLETLPGTTVNATLSPLTDGKVLIELENQGSVVAFFMRIRFTKEHSEERLLPVFLEDNYVTLLPGERRRITVDIASVKSVSLNDFIEMRLEGFNVPVRTFVFQR